MFESGQNFFFHKGIIPFQKIVELFCVCLCFVGLVALILIFAGL